MWILHAIEQENALRPRRSQQRIRIRILKGDRPSRDALVIGVFAQQTHEVVRLDIAHREMVFLRRLADACTWTALAAAFYPKRQPALWTTRKKRLHRTYPVTPVVHGRLSARGRAAPRLLVPPCIGR